MTIPMLAFSGAGAIAMISSIYLAYLLGKTIGEHRS